MYFVGLVTETLPPESQVSVEPATEEDSMYEGIESPEAENNKSETSTDGTHTPGRDRTGTVRLESLKQPVKISDIEGVIMEG